MRNKKYVRAWCPKRNGVLYIAHIGRRKIDTSKLPECKLVPVLIIELPTKAS